jgi:hypothetical protein
MLKYYETAHSYEDIIEFPSIFETFQLGHLTSHRVHKLLFSLVTVLQFEIVGKSLFSFVLSLTCDMRKHQFQCSVCDVQIPYHHLLMTAISPWSIVDIFVKINYSVNPSVFFLYSLYYSIYQCVCFYVFLDALFSMHCAFYVVFKKHFTDPISHKFCSIDPCI